MENRNHSHHYFRNLHPLLTVRYGSQNVIRNVSVLCRLLIHNLFTQS